MRRTKPFSTTRYETVKPFRTMGASSFDVAAEGLSMDNSNLCANNAVFQSSDMI